MTNDLAGRPLDYLIGRDGAPPGAVGRVVAVAFDCDQKAQLGPTIGYCNLLDEENKGSFGPYRPQTDTAKQYDEGVPDPAGPGFEANLRAQFDRRRRYGFEYVELDNPDAYALADVMRGTALAETYGLKVIAKNPLAMDVDATSWLAHPNVYGVIVEKDAGAAAQMDALRTAAAKPDLPVWFVFFGDGRLDAETARAQIANATIHGPLLNMGVTFDRAPKEYGGDVEDILLPIKAAQKPDVSPMPASTLTPLDVMKTLVGTQWSSGPPTPTVKAWLEFIASKYPQMRSYIDSLEQTYEAWCAIGVSYCAARCGMQPPFGDIDVKRWAYVDAYDDFGTAVTTPQAGDFVKVKGGGIHHITMFLKDLGNGWWQCLGANQGHEVKVSNFEARYCTPRRPPASAATAQPALPSGQAEVTEDPATWLMLGSISDAVLQLQGMLGFANTDVDGEYGVDTKAAVEAFQASRGLEVDGVVGPATWAPLKARTPAIPISTRANSLPADVVAKITALAGASSLAKYSWADRGRAPIGYIKGMAVAYGQVYFELKAGGSAALAMAAPVATSDKDALAWYSAPNVGDAVSRLRSTFALQIGLGMRESSGNYSEGRDISANNVTAETAEAGLFQQSWNSRVASPELPKLLAQWSASSDDGLLSIFREGVNAKATDIYGVGDGATFQRLCKSKPLFAVYCAAIGLRSIRQHWGPINRHEAELRPEADTLLSQVQAIVVDATPIGPIVMPTNPDLAAALAPITAAINADHARIDALTAQLQALAKAQPVPDTPAPVPVPPVAPATHTLDLAKIGAEFMAAAQKLADIGAMLTKLGAAGPFTLPAWHLPSRPAAPGAPAPGIISSGRATDLRTALLGILAAFTGVGTGMMALPAVDGSQGLPALLTVGLTAGAAALGIPGTVVPIISNILTGLKNLATQKQQTKTT